MNPSYRFLIVLLLCPTTAVLAQTRSPPTPQEQAGNPAVTTEPLAPDAVSADGSAPAKRADAQAAHKPSGVAAAPASAAAKATPAGAAKTSTAATAGAAKRSGAGANSVDRLELGTTEISGNRELPKVLYVVPWRRAELGDAVGRPPNSLVDEALAPVDRDVFQRQNRYYAALQAGAAADKSQPGTANAPAANAAPKDER